MNNINIDHHQQYPFLIETTSGHLPCKSILFINLNEATLKDDIKIYMDADKDIIDKAAKKDYYQEIVNFTSKVLEELKNRTWQLRGIIDITKYNGGS